MLALHELRGTARRRCLRLVRKVWKNGCLFVRGEDSFRDAERLHRAGLVTVAMSKWNWAGGRRPFRELAIYADEAEARTMYPKHAIMPRGH